MLNVFRVGSFLMSYNSGDTSLGNKETMSYIVKFLYKDVRSVASIGT